MSDPSLGTTQAIEDRPTGDPRLARECALRHVVIEPTETIELFERFSAPLTQTLPELFTALVRIVLSGVALRRAESLTGGRGTCASLKPASWS